MLITESIRNAIRAAIRKSGSSLSFSRSVGVSHTTVSYWLSGRTRKINSTVWQNLLPQLSEYLSPSESMSYPSGPVAAGNAGYVLRERPAVWYGGGVTKATASLLQLADLTAYDPQIDSIEELVLEKCRGTAMFVSPITSGCFAIEIGEGQSDFFPAGTRLLLCGQDAPGNGDTVLVKLRAKNDFLFAVYTRTGDEVVLSPLRGGRKRTIRKDDLHNVLSWIIPIREAVQLF